MVDLATELPLAAESDFAVGDVLGRSLSVFRRDFGKFVLLVGLILLPDLIVGLINPDITAGSNTAPRARGWSFILSLLQVFAELAVTSVALAQMNGRAITILDAWRESMACFRPAILVTILQVVAVILGLVLLIVPGLIAYSMMYVVLPVCVAQRNGATQSINRSAALTKGYRCKVLGTLLVANIGGLAAFIIVDMLASLLGPILLTLVTYPLQILYLAFTAVVGTVVYQSLRLAKEGPDIETLSEVFA
jgi:hypothetical protein